MRYICQICGYVYDDEKEKVPFEQLPEDWKCPLCGAVKSDFKPEVPKTEVNPVSVNTEAAGLFNELAAYFTSITPAVNDATVENVAKLLQEDIDKYPTVRAVVDQNKDRGAARICVWGEKVTRMLSSLVNRYLNEGEAMLADTDIWVCTVCGFVYIGETPPELCPVCKVPPYKFEKIEGRG